MYYVPPCRDNMNSGKTNIAKKASSHAPADVFICTNEPIYTWILSDTTTCQAMISTKCITCPIIILLNVLVVVAVLKRRQLQKNSHIMLASLAVADCLVGAISMPLSISIDALLLDRNTTVDDSFCRLAFANQLVLYAAVCSSLYHVTLIAWERYVAIRKWIHYKAIVTRKRVKAYVGIAWLLAVLTTTPVRILTALGLDYKYTKILDTILFLPALACLLVIGYFYIMVYLGVRTWKKISGISQLAAPTEMAARRERGVAKRVFCQTVALSFSSAWCKQRITGARASSARRARPKMATSIANTTAILALALLIFYVPSIAIRFLGETVPFLRTSSFFSWSELLTQLNSLVNPLLYCFVLNGNFTREAVKMCKMRGPYEIKSLTRIQRCRTRRVGTITRVLDAQEVAERGPEDCFEVPESRDFVTYSGTDYFKSRRAVVEESSLCPAVVNHIIRVGVHQPKPIECKPSIKASSSVINTEGQAHGTSGQCRCFLHHHRDQSSDDNDVMDKTEKPDTLVPSPNSKQPKSVRFQQDLEVTSSVIDKRDQVDGTSGQAQCGNKNAVVELASGQNKTTQGPKKTASSPDSYAVPEEAGVILSFAELQKRSKDGPTRETPL